MKEVMTEEEKSAPENLTSSLEEAALEPASNALEPASNKLKIGRAKQRSKGNRSSKKDQRNSNYFSKRAFEEFLVPNLSAIMEASDERSALGDPSREQIIKEKT